MRCFVIGNRILQDAAIRQRLQVLQAILIAVPNDFREIRIDRESRWNDEFRKRILHLLQFQAAAFRNLDRLIENVWNLAEDLIHFLRGS